MAEIKDQVDLQLINCEMYGEEIDDKFEQVKLEDAKKWDEYLKFEIIYWGEFGTNSDVTKLTKEYIKTNGDDILEQNADIAGDGTKYLRNMFIIDEETALGKEKMYIYDEAVDQVYKIPLTTIGRYKVHSIEELNYQQGNESDERISSRGTVIEEESSIEIVGNTAFYAPNLKGFVQERTSAVYYKTNLDGTLNDTEETLPITTYLSTKERTTVKSNSEYEFYNYEKKIWANIKVTSAAAETYWTWIPRYAYKLEGNETKVIYIDTNNKQAIDGEDLPEGYIVHSAFTENNKKGIWVSKYEVEQIASSKVEEFPHYLPDLKGFDPNTTYIEVYNDDGTFTETRLSDIKNIAEFAKKNRWFDYDNQIWANIKTDAYGAECWWVWIPRYAYKLTQSSEATTSVIFVDKLDKPLTGGDLPEGYKVHSAFEGGKKGIWASKYEITKETDQLSNNANTPDMSGFNPETTWIELYKDDGTFEEVKLSTINDIEKFARENRWYDYSKQIWANIKTKVDDAECWWVWIPRYAYYLWDNETRIIFLDENGKPKDGRPLTDEYKEHPGFEGKKGIWASKYEMSN